MRPSSPIWFLTALDRLPLLLFLCNLWTVSCSARVVELGVDNFYATLQLQRWTCVLFYDHWDPTDDYDDWVAAWEELSLPNLSFARLDIRRHAAYRVDYATALEGDHFLSSFYRGMPKEADALLVISHRTFMRGDLYFPPKIVLMGSDFRSYGALKLDGLTGDSTMKMAIAAAWLEGKLLAGPTVEVEMGTPLQRQEQTREANLESSDWDDTGDSTVHKYQRKTAAGKTDDIRLALEHGYSHSSGFYQYPAITLQSHSGAPVWLDELGHRLIRYLNWVEGYETVWDAERRQREDAQCQFGKHLETMNKELRDIVDLVLDDEGELRAIQYDDYPPNRDRVPLGLTYFVNEMVFGYGRSPASLRWYLENEVSDKLGDDAAARHQNRKSASALSLFERLRGYMQVLIASTAEDDLYEYAVSQVVTELNSILLRFHANLNKSYINYRYLLDSSGENPFPRKTVQVLDMDDPAHHDLLTNYDAFHEQYTQTATPVMLNHVHMTLNQNYTLEYLSEHCGGMDVSSNIFLSNNVLDRAAAEWGGMEPFKLNSDNDDTVTLQHFLALWKEKKLDRLHLHDFGLPEHCAGILYEKTMYGPHQKFQIPSVIASYDLFQRIALSSSSDISWPSLFIGGKGSNVKMDADRGATGFSMYLVSGRKRWLIAHPSERVFLYPTMDHRSVVPDVLGMDKSAEANNFLKRRFPLLQRMEGLYEVIQEPGQMIYIPPDCPFAVENLEDDTIGIGMNVVPKDGFARHIYDLIYLDRAFGHVEVALKYWLYEETAQVPFAPAKDPLYLTFGEYVGQI